MYDRNIYTLTHDGLPYWEHKSLMEAVDTVGCMCTLLVNVDAKLGAGIFAWANEVKMYAIGVLYITVVSHGFSWECAST